MYVQAVKSRPIPDAPFTVTLWGQLSGEGRDRRQRRTGGKA
jgi:hypothetical protein